MSCGKLEIIEVPVNHPDLVSTDAKVMNYRDFDYLTTVHIPACSIAMTASTLQKVMISRHL